MNNTTSALLTAIFIITSQVAFAGSATWNSNPTNGDWNTAANWTPATVPNGPLDTATFGASTITNITLSAGTRVSGITFQPGASSYTVTVPGGANFFIFTGSGITNNSSVTQSFVNSVTTLDLEFTGFATAGTQTSFVGGAFFQQSSNAGSGIFTLNSHGTFADEVIFQGTASASNGIFNVGGALSTDINSSASMFFEDSSTAGAATLIAEGGIDGGFGGRIYFEESSQGGTARLELLDNANLDISQHKPPPSGVGVGSIEGTGSVNLVGNSLTVGSNNLSTTFSGIIQDAGKTGGLFTKIGAGTLTLTGANLYSGTTTVKGGTLVVGNTTGSATGSGPLEVNSGTLGGSGIIAGAVTVGTGSGTGSFVAPAAGTTIQTRLTTQSALTLNSDATYTYTFKANSKHARTDMVIANGVTINGATLALNGTTQGQMKRGLVLTVINNTSANPISGTFSNLPDGAIVTVNGNNLQASYEGGDGNDLTLTVVP